MRVSKVKVDKNKMVLMYRTSEEGALVFENEEEINRTSHILPDKKMDSFSLSIENKTFIKRDSLKSKAEKDKYDIVKRIFTKKELPQSILEQNIFPYLNHKFQTVMKYYDHENKCVEFNLTELILKAVKKNDYAELKPYFDWKAHYIVSKSAILIKSIKNNKIDLFAGDSKRKISLRDFATVYTTSGTIDLTTLHAVYKIDELAEALLKVEKGELRDNEIPKDRNAYHRLLKKALQNHQQKVFGTRETPNITNRENNKLSTYHLEVVKYLERYFSVKTSSRRNTKADIAHYLKLETIKNTVQKQLINAVRNSLLQEGKAEHHQYAENIDSAKLTDIKRNEAFVLNMIGACAFAANNIRNIVDNEQDDDILGKREFKDVFANGRINEGLFKFFFAQNLPTLGLEKEKTLWAMRGAVQQIRNEVVHYKQNALNKIFNLSNFEFPNHDNPLYVDTIYKNALEKDICDLPKAFAQQLKTGGALSYYTLEDLKTLLETFNFSLSRSVVPFAPGFKKVHKHGQNYQNAESENFYNLELKNYLLTTQFNDEAYNARYFLLKLIYNNLFLPLFTANKENFSKTVKYVLTLNRQQAQSFGKPKAYAFEAVREMRSSESIQSYMAYLQSHLMLEQTKKEDEKPDEKRINFEKFVLQLFIKAFDDFLKAKEFQFISVPSFQLSPTDSKSQQADAINKLEQKITQNCNFKSHNIKAADATHVAFYVFCKLLDANHLSNLRNEFIKFRESADASFNWQHIIEIIELCLFHADIVPCNYQEIYTDKSACLARVIPFVEDGAKLTDWSDLFVQTDEETPVVHANVELAVKYGTINLLKQLIDKDPYFKLSESNFKDWDYIRNSVEILVNKREEFHQQWVDAKNKDDKSPKVNNKQRGSTEVAKFLNMNKENYVELCNLIETYNWLDNKLHFVHLSRLHHLCIEILGRMAGFVAIFDRDFQMLDARLHDDFCLNAFLSLRDIDEKLKKVNNISSIKEIEKIRKSDNALITESDRVNLQMCIANKRKYYTTIFFKKGTNPFVERNYIAHFNYLSTTASKYSLIDLINLLRDMLHYDRKLKNAVSKAFIDIFEKHGMVLKLKINETTHKLELDSLEPKLIYHLGSDRKNPITTHQVHKRYSDMCKALLEMKKE